MKKIPILIALPHSTNFLPEEVVSKMRISQKIRDEYFDVGSKEIFNFPNCFLKPAKYSRLFCDLNRAPDQIGENNMKNRKGVVLLRTMKDHQIYEKSLKKSDYLTRVAEHQNYYHEIASILKKQKIRFLISAHTMFSYSPFSEIHDEKRPDIAISNNNFATCEADLLNFLESEFERAGYKVGINRPFKGGFLLNYFCHRDRLQGVQIEFRRGLIFQNSKIEPKLILKHNHKIARVIRNFYQKFLQSE